MKPNNKVLFKYLLKMKNRIKYILLCFLLILLHLNLNGYEKDRVSLGGAFVGYIQPDEEMPHVFFAPNFGYERFLSDLPFGSVCGEINTCINPLKNNYSISMAIKFYTDRMTGYFLGFSPLSELNLYDFVEKERHLYYGIGIVFGGNFILNYNFDCEVKANLNMGILNEGIPGKMTFSWNLGYRF